MRKKLPALKSDKDAERLLERDLSSLIHADNFEPYPYEYKPKAKSVNLRISDDLLNAVRAAARRRGMPYQRYIRNALELSLKQREKI